MLLLQDKLNHYLEFIESGQLVEAKPEFKGLPVLIHVAAQYPLSDQATNFVSRAEFSAKLDAMADKLEGLRLLFSERKGHTLGTTATLGAMAVACGLISGLVFGILNLILKK